MSNNLVWHSHPVDRKTRAEQKLQEPQGHLVNRLLEYLHHSGVLKAGYAPLSISA